MLVFPSGALIFVLQILQTATLLILCSKYSCTKLRFLYSTFEELAIIRFPCYRSKVVIYIAIAGVGKNRNNRNRFSEKFDSISIIEIESKSNRKFDNRDITTICLVELSCAHK